MGYFNVNWEKIHSQRQWGKYPGEELIRFIARNYFSKERKFVKILEIGCGSGANLWFLAREGFCAYGIDGSKSAIENADRYLKENGLKAKLEIGDVSDLIYEDNFFDCVLDVQCIVANPVEGIKKIYKEVFRVLKPGGKFFSISFSDECSIFGNNEEIENNTYKEIKKGPLSDIGLVHLFEKNEIISLYRETGFKDIKIDWTAYSDKNEAYMIKSWVTEGKK